MSSIQIKGKSVSQGRVVGFNSSSGMFAVAAGDEYVVAEILTGEVAQWDEVRGDFSAHGSADWHNITQDAPLDVYVQAIGATEVSAKQLVWG